MKKLFALVALAMLLASCGGTDDTTVSSDGETTITTEEGTSVTTDGEVTID